MNPQAPVIAIMLSLVTASAWAAKAGIVPGNYIVEVEGKPVAGTQAHALKPYMQREVGQSTRIAIKKATGEVVTVILVAAPKAEGK